MSAETGCELRQLQNRGRDVPVASKEEGKCPCFDATRTSRPRCERGRRVHDAGEVLQLPQLQAGPRVRRALVVDDMPVNRRVLGKMLEACGVEEVVMAENGRRAIDLIAAGGAFDVVFTGLRMLVMDGVGLVDVIRETLELSGLPVYLVTTDVEVLSPFEFMRFTGFLIKPFSRADVRGLLDSIG